MTGARITPYSKFWKRNSRTATPDDDDEIDTMPISRKSKPDVTTMPIKKGSNPNGTTMPVRRDKKPDVTTLPIRNFPGREPNATTMPVGKKNKMIAARKAALQRRLRKSR